MKMKRILALILAGIMLLGAAGVAAFATTTAFSSDTGVVQLQSNQGEVSVEADTVLDLNGFDIQNLTVTSGTCYVYDSQTTDFAAGDYGVIKTYTGDVQALCTPEEDGCGWLMIDNNGTNASFHYVVLQISDMVLRAKNEGEEVYNPSLYYKCNFKGDEVVAQNVQSFGVALSVVAEPTAENLNTKCGYSVFTGFESGAQGNAEQNTGTLLNGIMKESNVKLVNKRNANLDIYGRAYIQLTSGDYVFGDCRTRTLKEQTEEAAKRWTLLNTGKAEDREKQATLLGMIDKFSFVVQEWDIPELDTAYNDLVYDSQTWYNEFVNLPVVDSSMSVDELRQLTIDTFRLQLSYKWTPNADFMFMDYENDYTTLTRNNVYVGTPYCMSRIYFDTNKDGVVDDEEKTQTNSIGSSNLFKVLKYYNPATGVLDIAGMGSDSNINNTLVNNCSGGLSWALGRVSNNHSLYTSNHYVPANGALPVGRIIINEAEITEVSDKGEVTYSDYDSLFEFGWLSGTNAYGQKKADFYKSYAELQPGDILVTPGHVRMCTGVYAPRDENGTLIYGECYAWYIDQNSYGSTDRWALENGSGYLSTQSNGATVRNLGGMLDDPKLGTKVSFQQLLKDEYIPLTIPEFCTEAELVNYKAKAQGYFEAAGKMDLWESTYAPKYDELIANRGIEAPYVYTTSTLYEQTKMTPEKFYSKNGSYIANYIISDFRVTIEDKNGNPIEVEYPDVSTGDRSKSVSVDTVRNASRLQSMETLTNYAGKRNKLKIETRLSTGQWYTVIHFEIA